MLNQHPEYQYLDIKTFLVDNNLTKVDRMSMANSLELRVPFLDISVVNAALALPERDRIHGFTTKVLLRKLMRGRLPTRVLKMQKKGFAVPLGFWFRGKLKKYVFDVLSPERIKATGVLEPQLIMKLIDLHMRGKADYNRQIWNLICFITWSENNRK